MSRPATAIVLTAEDRQVLTQRVRATTSEQRMVVRARIVLSAADGHSTEAIAEEVAVRAATVSKWRGRFAAPSTNTKPNLAPARPHAWVRPIPVRLRQVGR